MRDGESLVAARVVGGLLPQDLISKLQAGRELPGLGSADYHLAAGESVREAANRQWSYLTGVWHSFKEAVDKLPEGDRATALTRERWLLQLFRALDFGRLPTTPSGGIIADGKAFPISHHWESVPIHLLGWGIDLDQRTRGVAGAAGSAPQSLLQECLNRSSEHLWGALSNGRVLRLLRDSTALVGSAYIEFDLEAIFDGELFSDFLLLYTLCHQSRLEVRDPGIGPASCWLEQWRTDAIEQGTRALDLLRDGVIEALQTMGTGFIRHPSNTALRDSLANGGLQDFQHALLRTVYRLLFLFCAEDRGLLLDPNAPPTARQRYLDYFSTARLRAIARKRRGGRHGDLWRTLCIVIDGLGEETGRPELGLPGIGGLFDRDPIDVLSECELSNESLLEAVRALATVRVARGGSLRLVDYRNLGAEELGSIYESLLEYVPTLDATQMFTLQRLAGNERKTTGSYYTPSSLIEQLLESALDPLIAEAENSKSPRSALLNLTVCDPACGSGHFLVAAARRIAKRIAFLDTGDPEPTPDAVRSALREVVARCVYGVDVNPLAAELAKVSLWLEAMEPGKPLAYLDTQIKIGNSLLGVTPAALANGIPDAAFKPIEGDDKTLAKWLAKRNRVERDAGQHSLLGHDEVRIVNSALAAELRMVTEIRPGSLADVHAQARRHSEFEASDDFIRRRQVANAWCAAFVWQKIKDGPPPVTHQTLLALQEDPQSVPKETRDEIYRLASDYRFFHWHLEFPQIFEVPNVPGEDTDTNAGWNGGFTCLLGNPPWLSYSGRQAVRMRPGGLALLRYLFAAASEWPSAHASFALRVSDLLQRGGGAGLVLPMPVATLSSYGRMRQALSANAIDLAVQDQGEGVFPGVSQRVGTFTLLKVRERSRQGVFHVSTGQRQATIRSGETTLANQTPDIARTEILNLLTNLPRFPRASFSDPGVHTGNVAKLIILNDPGEIIGASVRPIREGKDIHAFQCGEPRKWLWIDAPLQAGQYCRMQPISRYLSVPIVLRQTADRPIATRHLAPTYFRNSLLACWGLQDVPHEVTTAILNSSLIGFWYRNVVLDSGQRAFPQVKVKSLRELPAFPHEIVNVEAALLTDMVDSVRQLETSARDDGAAPLRNKVDELVSKLYGLSSKQHSYLLSVVPEG